MNKVHKIVETIVSLNISVMSTPRDNPSDLSTRQSAELIRDFLDTKHGQSYTLVSVDQPSRSGQLPYRKEIFHNRVRFDLLDQ